MLADEIDAPEETTPEAVLDRYEAAIAEAARTVGTERAIEEAGLDPEAVESMAAGEAADEDLADAAAVLALAEGDDADALLAEARDGLLLGMTTAVLDVDTVAAEIGADISPREVQGKLEGRLPMTVGEYARIRHFIASRGG